jgi:hypothetical protein
MSRIMDLQNAHIKAIMPKIIIKTAVRLYVGPLTRRIDVSMG